MRRRGDTVSGLDEFVRQNVNMSTDSQVRPAGTILLLAYPTATALFAVVSLALLGRSTSGPFRSLGIALVVYGIGLSLGMVVFSVAESRREKASQVTIFGLFFCGALFTGFFIVLIGLISKAVAGSQTELVILVLMGTSLALFLYWLAMMAIRTRRAGLWSRSGRPE